MSSVSSSHPGWENYRQAVTDLEYLYGVKIQAKEKYGRMNLECIKNNPPASHPLWVLMDCIEVATAQACQTCGKNDAKQYEPETWVSTFCQRCAQESIGDDYETHLVGYNVAADTAPSRRVYETLSTMSTCTHDIEGHGDILQIYSVCRTLRSIEIKCKDGKGHSPKRDRPSWTFAEVDTIVSDLFASNPHIETIEFQWDGETEPHIATRDMPYSNKAAAEYARVQAGEISEDEWLRIATKKTSTRYALKPAELWAKLSEKFK